MNKYTLTKNPSFAYILILSLIVGGFSSCSRSSLQVQRADKLENNIAYMHHNTMEVPTVAQSETKAVAEESLLAKVPASVENTMKPVKKQVKINSLKNAIATTKAIKAIEKRIDNQVFASAEKKVQKSEASNLSGNLRTTLILAVVGLILVTLGAAIPGVGTIFYIVGSILLVVALIFLLLWILDEA